MKVRAGRIPGGPDRPDHLATLHVLIHRDVHSRAVRIERGISVAVVDGDEIAVAAVPASVYDAAVGRRANRRSIIHADIHAGVERISAGVRICTISEWR